MLLLVSQEQAIQQQQLIFDISVPQKRAQNFGLLSVTFGLDFIIVSVLGGLLGHYGPRILFLRQHSSVFVI